MRTSYGVVRRETSTLSSDGRSWLRIMVWLPDAAYTRRGIVQLIHGMSEHIGRYERFARFLAGLGYVVFGHDHIGHGKSVSSMRDLGHMPLAGGKEVLIEDVRRVHQAVMSEELAGADSSLPYFVFAHSMGSYIARVLIVRSSMELAGVVLCGTGNQPYALAVLGRTISRLIGTVWGDDHRSNLVRSLVSGPFVSAIDDPRTDLDWLCSDPAVVDAFYADPLSGSSFSVGAYACLTDLVAEAVSKKSAAKVPKDLPLLFISGEEDPVGSRGDGVKKAAELYRSMGSSDVEVILYPRMRHEILNEPDKMMVFSDVESWLTRRSILHTMRQERPAS